MHFTQIWVKATQVAGRMGVKLDFVFTNSKQPGLRIMGIGSQNARAHEGEGTLGLLLNDPTLFEDMQVLLGGAKRSALLRSMIRMAVEQEEEEP